MQDLAFQTSVKVRLREGAKTRRIGTVHEASILLESADWPGDRTQLHRDACDVADEALAGRRPAAPNALLLAAAEAGIPLELSADDPGKPNHIHFESSVCIQPHGGNTVREVKSVNGACDILIDWRHAKRGPYYQSAREVVQAALEGKASPAQARVAFVALAAHAGILAERTAE